MLALYTVYLLYPKRHVATIYYLPPLPKSSCWHYILFTSFTQSVMLTLYTVLPPLLKASCWHYILFTSFTQSVMLTLYTVLPRNERNHNSLRLTAYNNCNKKWHSIVKNCLNNIVHICTKGVYSCILNKTALSPIDSWQLYIWLLFSESSESQWLCRVQ